MSYIYKERGLIPYDPDFSYSSLMLKAPGWPTGQVIGGGTVVNSNGCPQGSYEKISYETPKFKRYGNCYHLKSSILFSDTSPTWGDYPTTNRWYLSNICGAYRHVENGPSFSTLDVPQLVAEAYQTMKPTLEAGFSLTNFLVELGEFKQMFRLWNRNKRFISNVGGGYLNYQFGWKLFVKDVLDIYEKLKTTEKRLNDYKSQQGKLLVRHFTVKLAEEEVENTNNSVSDENRKVSVRNKLFFCTMKYRYTVPALDRHSNEVVKYLAWMDSLGLKLTPGVIWEAIPFSFVVDWFINVGDYLNQLDSDNLDSVIEIVDFCYSIKSVTTHSHYIGIYTGVPQNPRERLVLKWEEAEYTRRRVIPDTGELFGLKFNGRYGSKQILLSAALLVA